MPLFRIPNDSTNTINIGFKGQDGIERLYKDSTLEALKQEGWINNEMHRYLSQAIKERKNILISDEFASGSTHVTQALTHEINKDEPIAIISQKPIIETNSNDALHIVSTPEPLSFHITSPAGGKVLAPNKTEFALSQEVIDEVVNSNRRIIFHDMKFDGIENGERMVFNDESQGKIVSSYSYEVKNTLAIIYYSMGKAKQKAEGIKDPEKYTNILEDSLPVTPELLKKVRNAFDIIIHVKFEDSNYKITNILEVEKETTITTPYEIPYTEIFTYDEKTGKHSKCNKSKIIQE